MKRRVGFFLSFVVGMVCGVLLMGFLSMRASKTYLEMAKGRYETEQSLLGASNWKKGNVFEAAIHLSNVVQVTSRPGSHAFDLPDREWPFAFPFIAPILDKIGEPNREEAAKAKLEAMHRGKLGVALEELGRAEAAQREYVAAAELLGIGEIDRVRRVGRMALNAQAQSSEKSLKTLDEVFKTR